VRLEIAAALQRQIPIVPILVEGAALPTAEELPAALSGLTRLNGLAVRPDPDFQHDMDRLMGDLAVHIGDHRSSRGKGLVIATVVAACLLIAGVFFVMRKRPLSAEPSNSNGPAPPTPIVEASAARVPIRYWIEDLPMIPEEDSAKLFSNALGSWQAVVTTPIRRADSFASANVIITTSSETMAVADVGPPSPAQPLLKIWFGTTVDWTPRTFEAASCRMLGHVLGLTYTDTPNQMMTDPGMMSLEEIPLTPQSEDITRIREIWDAQ
jgi:hypothetical protein